MLADGSVAVGMVIADRLHEEAVRIRAMPGKTS